MCAFYTNLECNNWEIDVGFSHLDVLGCKLDIVACKVHLECNISKIVFGFYFLDVFSCNLDIVPNGA
jgi:hypothetical protein